MDTLELNREEFEAREAEILDGNPLQEYGNMMGNHKDVGDDDRIDTNCIIFDFSILYLI